MKEWEYQIKEIRSVKLAEFDLNWQGEEGWELVCIVREDGVSYAVFKRPKI